MLMPAAAISPPALPCPISLKTFPSPSGSVTSIRRYSSSAPSVFLRVRWL
jgi:hypothetical protein